MDVKLQRTGGMGTGIIHTTHTHKWNGDGHYPQHTHTHTHI